MNNLIQSRLASVLLAVIGGWLLASPLFITITGPALISLMIVGGLFVVLGAVQFFWENSIPSWMAGLAAVWLVVSIVVFGLAGAALWSQVIAAAAALMLAVWDGTEADIVTHSHSHA